MSLILAVAGKGGTGKTTFSSLCIRALLKNSGPILAVDADANSNLPESLGIEVSKTVGGVLAEFMDAKLKIPAGMPKQAYLELKLNETVAESRDLDLVTMGRPEGDGCYCAANSVLKSFLETLVENYKWVVIDNEAGMEHLSRRTASRIDILVMVSDPSAKGIRTVKKLNDLVDELKIDVTRRHLVLNRTDALDEAIDAMIRECGVPLIGSIPYDPEVARCDIEGKPLLNLPEESIAVEAVNRMMEKIIQDNQSLSPHKTGEEKIPMERR